MNLLTNATGNKRNKLTADLKSQQEKVERVGIPKTRVFPSQIPGVASKPVAHVIKTIKPKDKVRVSGHPKFLCTICQSLVSHGGSNIRSRKSELMWKTISFTHQQCFVSKASRLSGCHMWNVSVATNALCFKGYSSEDKKNGIFVFQRSAAIFDIASTECSSHKTSKTK